LLNLTSALPDEIIAEIAWSVKSFIIIEIATFIYQHPSVPIKTIIYKFNSNESDYILSLVRHLEENNYIGIKDNHCYFIGRNPEKNNIRFRWAKVWDF
jgi:hypothetical protein